MRLYGLKDERGNDVYLQVELIKDDGLYWKLKNIVATGEDLKPQFKVGDWVAILRENGEVICIAPYLSLHDKKTCILGYENKYQRYYENINRCRPATKEEIETHLKKIASEKGFAKGVKFRKTWDADDIYGTCGNKLGYIPLDDTLTYNDEYPGDIYCKGKWAEIIPEKKKLPIYKETASDLLMDFGNYVLKNKDNAILKDKVDSFLNQYED